LEKRCHDESSFRVFEVSEVSRNGNIVSDFFLHISANARLPLHIFTNEWDNLQAVTKPIDF